jgi:mercuric ion transport protein
MDNVSIDRRPDKTIALRAGALVTAFLASLCCLGPLAFAVLGLGGAGALLKFVPFRPYFAVLTLALLGAGFYFTYRPARAAADASDCDCAHPKSNTLGKAMLWIATLLVISFLGFPYIAPHLCFLMISPAFS